MLEANLINSAAPALSRGIRIGVIDCRGVAEDNESLRSGTSLAALRVGCTRLSKELCERKTGD